MAESALAALTPSQRLHLQTLGFELYVPRTTSSPNPGAEATPATARSATRLALLCDEDLSQAPPLLQSLLNALALQSTEVGVSTDDNRPTLALGLPADAGTPRIELPSLAALRDARTKRAVWPRLRALRRHLAARAP